MYRKHSLAQGNVVAHEVYSELCDLWAVNSELKFDWSYVFSGITYVLAFCDLLPQQSAVSKNTSQVISRFEI